MQTVISVKVDQATKEAAQAVAKSAGLSLSTLINAYLKQVVTTRRIELYAPEAMTPALESLIAEVEKEITHKKFQVFDSVEALRADLTQ